MSVVKSYSFPDGEIRGDMFYIKHGSNNFTLIDCYLTDANNRNGRKEEIINEIVAESKGRTCRFISTHPDNDHIAGIEDLDDNWEILNFYAVVNERPEEKNNPSLTHYHWLLKNKNYAIERGISRKWLNDSDDKNGSSGINFQWPDVENESFVDALEKVSEGKKINNICPIFTYSIKGGATYMWMGDLETEMQQAYFEEYNGSIPKIDILFQPHHGRKSGAVPQELLDALNPKLIIIGNAPSEHIEYGDSHQTITQNTSGDILLENEDNFVHVYTKNKIDNAPDCLQKVAGKGHKRVFKDNVLQIAWHYQGSLDVSE